MPPPNFDEVLRLDDDREVDAIATTLFVRERRGGLVVIDKVQEEWIVIARIGTRATEVTIGVKDYIVTTLEDGTIVVLEKK